LSRVAILTASDRAAVGARDDVSGKVINEIITAQEGLQVCDYVVVPDNQEQITDVLLAWCESGIDLVLTTGGTGFGPRDRTPEATKAVIEREVPGIPEAMRVLSLQKTDRAMLSRAVAGIRKQTLIINLPGSPKAVEECLEYILPAVRHGLDILGGNVDDCAAGTEDRPERDP